MRIADMLVGGRPTVSFEFMAPRDESEVDALEKTIAAIAGHAPDWGSVTYRKATGAKTLELRYMTLKVESGADFLITQLFFDNRFYFDLVRRASESGVELPIVPGLMPVPSRRSLAFMTSMAGATVPAGLESEIAAAADDEAGRAAGVRHFTAQCVELLEAGVPGLHFYTFNPAPAPME